MQLRQLGSTQLQGTEGRWEGVSYKEASFNLMSKRTAKSYSCSWMEARVPENHLYEPCLSF